MTEQEALSQLRTGFSNPTFSSSNFENSLKKIKSAENIKGLFTNAITAMEKQVAKLSSPKISDQAIAKISYIAKSLEDKMVILKQHAATLNIDLSGRISKFDNLQAQLSEAIKKNQTQAQERKPAAQAAQNKPEAEKETVRDKFLGIIGYASSKAFEDELKSIKSQEDFQWLFDTITKMVSGRIERFDTVHNLDGITVLFQEAEMIKNYAKNLKTDALDTLKNKYYDLLKKEYSVDSQKIEIDLTATKNDKYANENGLVVVRIKDGYSFEDVVAQLAHKKYLLYIDDNGKTLDCSVCDMQELIKAYNFTTKQNIENPMVVEKLLGGVFQLDKRPIEKIKKAKENHKYFVTPLPGKTIEEIAAAIAGKKLVCTLSDGFEIDGEIYSNPKTIVELYNRHIIARESTRVQPQLTAKAQERQLENEKGYGKNVERMKASKTAEKVISKVAAAREAYDKAVTMHKYQDRPDQDLAKIAKEQGVNSPAYKEALASREAIIRDNKKAERKARKKERAELRKAGIKKNVDPSLLHQRDHVASEMKKMESIYGTANNEEYQARIDQLKELDTKIFGKRRAKRIYKDWSKPVYLKGGDFVEIPKKYLDMVVNYANNKPYEERSAR